MIHGCSVFSAVHDPFSSGSPQTKAGGHKSLQHTECLTKHFCWSDISQRLCGPSIAHHVQYLAPICHCTCSGLLCLHLSSGMWEDNGERFVRPSETSGPQATCTENNLHWVSQMTSKPTFLIPCSQFKQDWRPLSPLGKSLVYLSVVHQATQSVSRCSNAHRNLTGLLFPVLLTENRPRALLLSQLQVLLYFTA